MSWERILKNREYIKDRINKGDTYYIELYRSERKRRERCKLINPRYFFKYPKEDICKCKGRYVAILISTHPDSRGRGRESHYIATTPEMVNFLYVNQNYGNRISNNKTYTCSFLQNLCSKIDKTYSLDIFQDGLSEKRYIDGDVEFKPMKDEKIKKLIAGLEKGCFMSSEKLYSVQKRLNLKEQSKELLDYTYDDICAAEQELKKHYRGQGNFKDIFKK